MSLAGKRIGLLTASASRRGGGVFEAVVRQAALIAAAGATPVVVALHDAEADEDRARFGDISVRHVPVRGPRQIGWAPGLGAALLTAELDLLHLHGIWMYPSRAGARWATTTRRPYIVSPHGMLDPWITARGRWKKALARYGYERRSWRAASVLHALTDAEADDIARETGRHDAAVIPNAAPRVRPSGRARNGVLYLGRIHPKKNIEALIAAWASLATGAAALTIAGWGEPAHVRAVEDAIDTARDPSIRFVGAVHGAAKQALLDGARWLILPSLSEGLPMVVLEAWAAGTPTIMTDACHLPEGVAGGTALSCGPDVEALAAALTAALAIGEGAWRRRSAAAIELADGPFSAAAVSARWHRLYAALLP